MYWACIELAGLLAFLTCCLIKFIRYITFTSVNCWFCNSNQTIRTNQTHSWECLYCKQRNTSNEEIDPSTISYDFESSQLSKKSLKSQNVGFCADCNSKQAKKISELTELFDNNDYSSDQYSRYSHTMDRIYPLCQSCQAFVDHKLYGDHLRIKREMNIYRQSPLINKTDSKSVLCDVTQITDLLGCGLGLFLAVVSLYVLLTCEYDEYGASPLYCAVSLMIFLCLPILKLLNNIGRNRLTFIAVVGLFAHIIAKTDISVFTFTLIQLATCLLFLSFYYDLERNEDVNRLDKLPPEDVVFPKYAVNPRKMHHCVPQSSKFDVFPRLNEGRDFLWSSTNECN